MYFEFLQFFELAKALVFNVLYLDDVIRKLKYFRIESANGSIVLK